MEYGLLKFFHLIGAVFMGGGLIGVWMADLRSRQLHELKPFPRRFAILQFSTTALSCRGLYC